MQNNKIGAIAFCELACNYFKNQDKKNAVRNLNKWIERNRDLKDELATCGYLPRKHQILTPKQHNVILHHLGEPGE